jgi:hypothetical protein
MKRKILTATIFVTMLLLPLFSIATVSETTTNERGVELTVEVTGRGREYQISVYVSNSGRRPVTLEFSNSPGGGFTIYNRNRREVFHTPEVVLPMIWSLTLRSREKHLLYTESWNGATNNGLRLPSGAYAVKGFADLLDRTVYSEPVTIRLPGVQSKLVYNFLAYFPILSRLLILF